MIKREVAFGVTPVEIAHEFAAMDSRDQAQFLNVLATYDFWPMQLQYVTDCDLTPAARSLMELFGEYARNQSKPRPACQPPSTPSDTTGEGA